MLAALLSLAAPTVIEAATFSVGPGCDHSVVATAVFAAYLTPEDDLIKITANLTNQSIVIDDFHPTVRGKVTIRGGYTSCADTTASGRSVIAGTANNPVVRVETSNESQSRAILENLELRGSGVRGLSVTAGGHLSLANVRVVDNDGGGAFVGASGTLVTNGNTVIQDNGWGATAVNNGGGIECYGGYLYLRGAIAVNAADFGGGIAAHFGCTAEFGPGLSIDDNHAYVNGGGLLAL